MSYASQVLADLPTLLWELGEPSGTTATDSSGNSHTGTYHGSPGLAAAGLVSQDASTAVLFDASTEYAESASFGGSAIPYTTGCALEAVVRVEAVPQTSRPVALGDASAVSAIRLDCVGTTNVATDSSGNARNGAYNIDVTGFTYQTTVVGGITPATGVESSGDAVAIPIAANTFHTDFTLGGWFDARGANAAIDLGSYVSTTFVTMVSVTYDPTGNPGFTFTRTYSAGNTMTAFFPLGLGGGSHFWAITFVESTGVVTLIVDGASPVTQTFGAHAMTYTEYASGVLFQGHGATYQLNDMFICPSAVANATLATAHTDGLASFTTWTSDVVAMTPNNFYHLNDPGPALHVKFSFQDSGAGAWHSGPGYSPKVGEIHHYVGVYDPAIGASLYVDGNIYETAAVGSANWPVAPATSVFAAGGFLGTTPDLTIQNAAFYNYRLPDARIAVHGALVFATPPNPTLSPVVRLVTARALVVPHQIQRFVVPIICTDKVEVGPGEYIEQSQDVSTIREWFVQLRRNGTVVAYQEGSRRFMCVVRDVSFAEGQVTRWGIQRGGLQGTLMVTLDSVES